VTDTLEDLGLVDPKDLEPVPPPWLAAGVSWHEWAVARGLCRHEHDGEERRA
jgi:hypothetical protein